MGSATQETSGCAAGLACLAVVLACPAKELSITDSSQKCPTCCPFRYWPSTVSGSRSALAGLRCLLCGGGACSERTFCRGSPAFVATFLRGCRVDRMTPARTILLAAASHFVHRGPGTPLSLFFRYAAFLVSFFNVLGLAFLFFSIFGFVASWHLFVLRHTISWFKPPCLQSTPMPRASRRARQYVLVEGGLWLVLVLFSPSMEEQKECQGMGGSVPPPCGEFDQLKTGRNEMDQTLQRSKIQTVRRRLILYTLGCCGIGLACC